MQYIKPTYTIRTIMNHNCFRHIHFSKSFSLDVPERILFKQLEFFCSLNKY